MAGEFAPIHGGWLAVDAWFDSLPQDSRLREAIAWSPVFSEQPCRQGAAPLEVWMRAGDLGARRFHLAWCITRTD